MTVSIVMASYNGALYIGQQLESLLQQKPPPDEIIITDDGSTDDTAAIVAACAEGYPKTRILFSPNESRLGVTGNFARALALASGDLIFYCDQDDLWSPGRLSHMAQALQQNPRVTLVYGEGLVADEQLNPIGISLLEASPLPALPAQTPEAVTRVEANVPGCIIAFPAWIKPYLLPYPAGWFHDHATAYLAVALGEAVRADAPPMIYRRHRAAVSDNSRLVKQSLLASAKASREAPKTIYHDELQRWCSMAARLAEIPDEAAPDLARLNAFRAVAATRAQLAETRLHARQKGRLRRFPTLLGLYLRGDYRRFLRGWRTFARDLWMG